MAAKSSSTILFFVFIICSSSAILPTAYGDPVTCSIKAAKHSDGKWGFAARISVQGTPSDFSIDTAAQAVSKTKCTAGTTQAFNFTLDMDSWRGTGSGDPFTLTRVPVACSGSQNILGLAPASTFLRQVWNAVKLPHTFAYCLVPSDKRFSDGELAFGREIYRLFYNTDVLNSTLVTLSRIPLKLTSSSYQLELTGVGLQSQAMMRSGSKDVLQVGATSRYTRLPEKLHTALRTAVSNAAAKRGVRKAETSFGELDLCFKMTPAQLTAFPKAVLQFGSAQWVVWPENYMVPKPGAAGVACFGMLGTSGVGAIGTLQQEENWIEYHVANKTLGVSGYLPSILSLSCSKTSGS